MINQRAFGPLPTPQPQAPPALSSTRQAVLTALRQGTTPVTLTALATAMSLHANTIRDHLEALTTDGLVTRHPAEPSGRGRPAWLYAAARATTASDRSTRPEYAGLAVALASSIAERSADPRADALDAGQAWGAELAAAHGTPERQTPASARRDVVSLLDDLGFTPRTDARARSIRLTTCPLLEAARRHPDVVCAVHLGIVRGALAGWSAPETVAELTPFSEPGACRLHLAAADAGAGAGAGPAYRKSADRRLDR
ncbi:MAG: helix-turn-helix domain-containing protein [Nostocoides sp.]